MGEKEGGKRLGDQRRIGECLSYKPFGSGNERRPVVKTPKPYRDPEAYHIWSTYLDGHYILPRHAPSPSLISRHIGSQGKKRYGYKQTKQSYSQIAN